MGIYMLYIVNVHVRVYSVTITSFGYMRLQFLFKFQLTTCECVPDEPEVNQSRCTKSLLKPPGISISLVHLARLVNIDVISDYFTK